jgi:hypothetical protein
MRLMNSWTLFGCHLESHQCITSDLFEPHVSMLAVGTAPAQLRTSQNFPGTALRKVVSFSARFCEERSAIEPLRSESVDPTSPTTGRCVSEEEGRHHNLLCSSGNHGSHLLCSSCRAAVDWLELSRTKLHSCNRSHVQELQQSH